MTISPPTAPKIHTETTWHDHVLRDDYGWLRQENWQEMFADTSLLRDDIRRYLQDENDFTEQNLTVPNKDLIEKLVHEMKGRTEIFFDSAPERNGEFDYFRRYSDAEYPVYLRRRSSDSTEEVLLDVNKEFAENGQKVFLHSVDYSPDNRWLAIVIDFSGSENYQLLLKNLDTGKFADEKIEEIGDIEWAPDSQSFYYTKYSDNPNEYRLDRVFRHKLGGDKDKDDLIFSESATNLFLRINKTDGERFLVISLSNSVCNESHLLDLKDTSCELVCPAARNQGILYDIEHHGDRFFILTNKDNATDFQIMCADTKDPRHESWHSYQPHQPGCYLQTINLFQNHLVQFQTEKALPQIVITDLQTQEKHKIAFEEQAYSLSLGHWEGFESDWMRFAISSPRLPTQIYNYNMKTRERVLVRQETIPSHNPDNYRVERISVPSHDGVVVPLTIIRHKDTKLDGTAPVRLYAYGSYGTSIPSSFARYNKAYSLLDRGFIFAEAHIRGGSDCGYQWYLDGKLGKKKNTFLDFIACAEWLAEHHYTSRGNIAAEGRSAGGLLMGAVANMAPEGLFGCMIADVPFVDLMNTILDKSLPLTPPEWDEWGNPIMDKEAFDYMLSYSPYDNVTAKNYPAMFVSGGLTDPRVTYWEPAKWVAKLRDLKTDKNPIYLHINLDVGHGGDPGRFGHLFETAREYAFLLNNLSVPNHMEQQ